jgi:hypothetical protein
MAKQPKGPLKMAEEEKPSIVALTVRAAVRGFLSKLTGRTRQSIPSAFVDRLRDYEDHLRHLLIVEPAPTLDDLNSVVAKHDAEFTAARQQFLIFCSEEAEHDAELFMRAQEVEAAAIVQIKGMFTLFEQVKSRVHGGHIVEGRA